MGNKSRENKNKKETKSTFCNLDNSQECQTFLLWPKNLRNCQYKQKILGTHKMDQQV